MKGAQALVRIIYTTAFCPCHCCEDKPGIYIRQTGCKRAGIP